MIRKLTGVAVVGLLSLLLSTPALAQKVPDEKDPTDPSGSGECAAGDQCCECKKICADKYTADKETCNFVPKPFRLICTLEAMRAKKTCDSACNVKGGCNDTQLP